MSRETVISSRLRRLSASAAADGLVASALAAAVASYILSFPHYLGDSDEGLILYEAKRLLGGEVYFRDIFDMVPPGSQYVAAGAFSLFGTTVATARALDAVVHALITVALYACCRTAGVRRPLAVLTSALQPLLFWPLWPYVSPHWMSGLLWLVLVAILFRRPWSRHPAGAAAVGVILGLMGLVQQQRAAIASLGMVLYFAVDGLVERRFGAAGTWRTVLRRIGACAIVAALVSLPPLIALAVRSGFEPMVRALILHPLTHYGVVLRPPPWGTMLAPDTFAAGTLKALVRWLPAALIGVAAVGLVGALRRERIDRVRVALGLSAVGAVAIASTLYFPDLIHVAFLAPIGATAAAVLLEWGAQAAERRWPASVVATGIAAFCIALAVFGWRALQLRHAAWAHVATSAPTPFGRVDFFDARMRTLVEGIDERAGEDPQRRLFVYPFGAALYLLTDTQNPTPMQIIYPGYSFADQVDEALAVVEHQRSPLVVFVPGGVPKEDRFLDVLSQHYTRVPDQPFLWQPVTPDRDAVR